MGDLRARTTLFCAALALAIALSTLLRGRRAVHLLFAAFATDVAFWYASQSLASFFQYKAIWLRMTAILTVMLPQFAVHSFQSIVPADAQKAPTTLTRVATVAFFPMLGIALSPYNETPYGLVAVYVYVLGLLAAALVTLAGRGARHPSRAVRDRVRFLVAVGGLAMTFTLADFVSYLGLYLPPIGAVLAIVFLFVLAESVTRARLADLYEMASRLLVSTALAFALAGIFYVFVAVIGRFSTMYLNAVLSSIVFLTLFDPLRNEVEMRMHQFFFRERYDLETSVTELRRRLSHALEINEMVTTLLAGLERSRRVTGAALYLRDQEGTGFDVAGAIGPAPLRVEGLAARPLLDRLKVVGSLSLEELAREERSGDTQVLATATSTLGPLKGAVVLAVRGDDAELVGLLCVTDDRVKDAFTPEEIGLLETITSQIGVAIANSRIYSRMKERDRLAALGALAAGLAHEVKNPLGAIKGAAQLLEEVAQDADAKGEAKDEAGVEYVGIILEEVDRLNRVVGSFLDYARPRAGNPVAIDINAAVRRCVQILTSTQGLDDVEVQLELADVLPRAKLDPEQFRQVLMNLIQNAMQAMSGRGKVTVTTSQRRISRGWPIVRPREAGASGDQPEPDSSPGYVEVSVRDNGPGIEQQVLRNLFVPFFTTKERGTGLGLAISQSIVQNAGGSIDVQSQPGAGATFTIILPAASTIEPLRTPLPAATALPVA